jgi:S1-C subfamily serine protease
VAYGSSIFYKGFRRGHARMKKCLFFIPIIVLLLQITLLSAHGQVISPADIVDRYSEAIVLIASVKDGKEVELGSGFIIASDGIIITGLHILIGAYPAIVKTKTGDVYDDISVIDFNTRQDIAVIKIKGFDLPFVRIGNSNEVRIGDKVLLIGKANDSKQILADGLVVQILESINGYSLFQLSIPSAASLSGSPVFNYRGDVIGITTQPDQTGHELSCSIPINYARGMANGPTKFSLQELERTVMASGSLTEVNERRTDRAEIIQELHKHVVTLLTASDHITYGFYVTSERSSKKLYKEAYPIDQRIYSAIRSLKSLHQDLSKMDYLPIDYREIRDVLSIAATSSYEAANRTREALERRTIKSSVLGSTMNYASPDWNRALAGVGEIDQIVADSLDETWVTGFIEKVSDDNPELDSELLPFLVEVYEDKGKKKEQLNAEDKLHGDLGITTWKSLRSPTVLVVKKNGPAYIAKIKRGDIILGADDGMEFRTNLDYTTFQKATRPGETHIYRISRDGQVLRISVKLD